MSRVLSAAGVLCLLLSGCPAKPAPTTPTTSAGPAITPPTPAATPVETRPQDDAASVTALEQLGVKLTKDASGSVTALDAVSVDMKDADLQHLKGLHSLVDLDVAKTSITDAGLAVLQFLPQLKALNLQRCNLVTDAGLANLQYVPELERLQLLYTLIGNDGMEHVAKLHKLKVLDLRGSKVSDEGLAKLENHPSLVDIKLRAASITDTGLQHVATIKQLRTIEAEDTYITDDGLPYLAPLTDLQKLNLWRSYVGLIPDSFQHLSGMTKLKDLRLRGTGVRAVELKYLVGAKDTLKYLDMIECPIDDAELENIEPFQNLEALEIWQTNLGDAGLAHIAKLQNLKNLDVSICRNITSAGMDSVATLSKLETLNLAETGIDDTGLEKLAMLTKLKTLDLRKTGVTAEGAAKFEAAVPGCKITR